MDGFGYELLTKSFFQLLKQLGSFWNSSCQTLDEANFEYVWGFFFSIFNGYPITNYRNFTGSTI